MKKILKLALFGLVVVLLITELFLRLFYNSYLSGLIEPRPDPYVYDSVMCHTYIPNYTYTYEPTGNKFYFNEFGFKGLFPEKVEGRHRIALIGDSYVAGELTQEFTSNFCTELDGLFRENGIPVDIMNCGIDGTERSLNEFRSIRHKVLDMEPDLILLYYSLPFMGSNTSRLGYKNIRVSYPKDNDSVRNILLEHVDRYDRNRKLIDGLYKFHTVKLFFKLADKYKFLSDKNLKLVGMHLKAAIGAFKADYNYEYCTMEESARMVLDLRDELKEKGINFFLFSIDPSDDIKMEAKQFGLPLVMVNAALDPEYDLLHNNVHPNQQGHKKIAAKFYEVLTRHNLVPSRVVLE